MKFAMLVFLFFFISLPFYFLGYPSVIGAIFTSQGSAPVGVESIIKLIASKFINLDVAVSIVGLALAAWALSGFAAVYLVPAIILSVIVNLVLIPTGDISSFASCAGVCVSNEIFVGIRVFLNLIVILALIEFIRGGG